MAIAPPELTITLKVKDDNALEKSRAKVVSYTTETEAIAGRSVTVERAKTNAKLEAANELSQNRIKNKREQMLASLSIAEEKARLKSIKGQESWSARMTRSLDQVALSIKGMAAAWAIAQVTSMVRGSISLAGGMADLAAGVQLSTQEYFALTSALRDAGVQAEKIDPMFTRLNDLISGGATGAQQTILDRLGINATGMSNVQFMDTLLAKINSKLVTQAELGELVGNRIVPVWNRLAYEIKDSEEALGKYNIRLSEMDIEKLDKLSQTFETAKVSSSLFFADTLLNIETMIQRLGIVGAFLAGPGAIFGGAVAMSAGSPRQYGAPNPVPTRGFDTGLPTVWPDAKKAADETERRLRAESEIADIIFRSLEQQRNRKNFRDLSAPDEMGRMWGTWNSSRQEAIPKEFSQNWEDVNGRIDNVFEAMERLKNSDAWTVSSAGAAAFSNILSLQGQMIQNQADALQNLMNMERERWRERSEFLRSAGLENSAIYRNEQRDFERLDKEKQKKLQKLQAKAFDVGKKASMANAIMGTAEGIIRAFADKGLTGPFRFIMAAIVAAQGAAQIATISAQQNPYKGYAFGGLVHGEGFGDEQPIFTQGGEFVATREATRRNRGALEFINAGGDLQGGGITVNIMGDIIGDPYYIKHKLIPQIQKALDEGYKLRLA